MFSVIFRLVVLFPCQSNNSAFSHLENPLSVDFRPAHQKLSAKEISVAVSYQGAVWKPEFCILVFLFYFDNVVIRKL